MTCNQYDLSQKRWGGRIFWIIGHRSWESCKRRKREAAIAEGKKPLTTRGPGGRRKLPQRGLGQSPRNRRDFEHFMPNGVHFGHLLLPFLWTVKSKRVYLNFLDI